MGNVVIGACIIKTNTLIGCPKFRNSEDQIKHTQYARINELENKIKELENKTKEKIDDK